MQRPIYNIKGIAFYPKTPMLCMTSMMLALSCTYVREAWGEEARKESW